MGTCIGSSSLVSLRIVIYDNLRNLGEDVTSCRSALNDDLQQCPFCTQPFSGILIFSFLAFLSSKFYLLLFFPLTSLQTFILALPLLIILHEMLVNPYCLCIC